MENLLIPAFIAGLLTFLAPCTLPLVPGFLGFISGSSINDLGSVEHNKHLRHRVLLNAFFYVFGFSLVFILLGSLFGLLGNVFSGYRILLEKIGGAFVIFFGLYMMKIFDFKWLWFLHKEKKINLFNKLVPGKPSSSFIFGMTFAFGWTPCVGPVLGSILLLASTTSTVWQGMLLLSVFSLGLAVPFITLALLAGQAVYFVRKLNKFLNTISFIGGLFLVFLGVLVITGNMGIFVSWFYQLFDFMNYQDKLLDYL